LNEICVTYGAEFGIKSGEDLIKQFSSTALLRVKRYLVEVEFLLNI